MSLEAIDIMNSHRDSQFELSPSSEKFQIVGGSSFWGIFDKAHLENNKDSGNILQKRLTPLITVSTVPSGLIAKTSQIKREKWVLGDQIYVVNFIGTDEEGIPIIWLF